MAVVNLVKGDNMSSITELKVFRKLGLLVALMLGLMLCSSLVRAGLTVAPDFTVTDIHGNNFTLSGNRGKVVLIDFFATWCGHCINEMAELKTVYNHFGSSIVLISVDEDNSETDAKISNFASNNGITWTIAGGGSGVYAAYENLLFPGVLTGIPALFTVDQNRYIRFNHAGDPTTDPGSSASNLISEIEQLQAPFGVTLTVNTSPSLSSVHFRVDGANYYTSGGSFSVELTAGQHQVQLVDTTVAESGDTAYEFSHWSGIGSGSANSLQMEIQSSSTLEADFNRCFKTVFTQSGSAGTPHVTVDGTSYILPQTFWFESGSSHNFQYESLVVGAGIQYLPTSTSYTSPITVASPTTITANYKTQYYVTVNSEHGEPTPSQWVDKGSTLITTVTSTADDHGAGTRYNCVGYKINEGSLQPGTTYALENIQAPEEINFQWTTQYRLTLNASPNCLILQSPGSPSDSWYDAGSSVTCGAQAVNDCRLICWTLDGTSLVNTQLTVTMDKPHTATVGLLPP